MLKTLILSAIFHFHRCIETYCYCIHSPILPFSHTGSKSKGSKGGSKSTKAEGAKAAKHEGVLNTLLLSVVPIFHTNVLKHIIIDTHSPHR